MEEEEEESNVINFIKREFNQSTKSAYRDINNIMYCYDEDGDPYQIMTKSDFRTHTEKTLHFYIIDRKISDKYLYVTWNKP
jgi:hypothetical protein